MKTIRELRRALFEVEDQDRAADLGGVIALATGDPTLGERPASLPSSLEHDTGIPPDPATEAAALAESLGFLAGADEPATGAVWEDLDSGGRVDESLTMPAIRIRVADSGTILEGGGDDGEVER